MVEVTVPLMGCRGDVRTISAHIADVEGVVALQVDLATRTVRVHGDVSLESVLAAIASAGYAVSEPPA